MTTFFKKKTKKLDQGWNRTEISQDKGKTDAKRLLNGCR